MWVQTIRRVSDGCTDIFMGALFPYPIKYIRNSITLVPIQKRGNFSVLIELLYSNDQTYYIQRLRELAVCMHLTFPVDVLDSDQFNLDAAANRWMHVQILSGLFR